MESISATKSMKVKAQSATQNGHVEDKMGKGGAAFERVYLDTNGNEKDQMD